MSGQRTVRDVGRKIYRRSPVSFQRIIQRTIQRGHYHFNKWKAKSFPIGINLSLSVLCQAQCIFCPPTRGKSIFPKFMSLELAKKIIDEASAMNFKGRFNLGENGEALLNPDFIAILEYLCRERPNNPVRLTTNMDKLDKEMSRRVLSLGLNELHCNIDGATKETYEYVKGRLSFEKVKRNLHDFFIAREEIQSPCKIQINILTARRYIKYIKGIDISLPDDTREVIEYWQTGLREGDGIFESGILLWAIRDLVRKPKTTPCTQLPRVETECFIAPNGDIYICCLDYNAETTFGNINESSISEIWNSPKRFQIIKNLKLRNFQKIGEPCEFCLD